jgi:TetR/AcrR family transcriptional regulator
MSDYFVNFPTLIHDLEQQGLVTRTFRRLDPDRQQAVLNAILDEAAEAGVTELNIKRVAERCGAATGSLYQYFGSRANLLAFATELVVRTTVATFAYYTPYLAALPLREALRAYLAGGVEWSREQRGVVRFFARAAYQGDPTLTRQVVEPVATVLTGMMRAILQASQERGEIRAGVDLEAAGRVINLLMIGLGDAQLLPYLNAYYQLSDETIAIERTLQAAFALVENGISVEQTHADADHLS